MMITYNDDQLQQLTVLDVNNFNRETESLHNDEDQESHLSDEARELLGSGFSEYLPNHYNDNHVDNF